MYISILKKKKVNNLVRFSPLSLHWVRMAEINNRIRGYLAGLTQWTFKTEIINVYSGSGFLCSSADESAIQLVFINNVHISLKELTFPTIQQAVEAKGTEDGKPKF